MPCPKGAHEAMPIKFICTRCRIEADPREERYLPGDWDEFRVKAVGTVHLCEECRHSLAQWLSSGLMSLPKGGPHDQH